jgi:hypothetical protein
MIALASIRSVTAVGDRGIVVRDTAGRMLVITGTKWLAVDPHTRRDVVRPVRRERVKRKA